jgi:hypothetical protein
MGRRPEPDGGRYGKGMLIEEGARRWHFVATRPDVNRKEDPKPSAQNPNARVSTHIQSTLESAAHRPVRESDF